MGDIPAMKKFFTFIMIVILCFIGGCAVAYFTNGQVFDLAALATSTPAMIAVLAGGAGYLLYIMDKLGDAKPKKEGPSAKTKDGKDMSQFFDSRWVTQKELKTEKKFMFTTWRNLHDSKDGILIRAEKGEKNKNELEINMYSPIHTMVIGTTGVGKTQKYIEPSIQILSSTKTKPSFVITDPKGELYEHHRHKLQAEGYDVKTFNLRQPYASTRWNPMDNAYELYHKAHNLEKEVKTHVGVNPADLKLRIIAHEYNHKWYEYNGIAYPNKEALNADLTSKRAELIDLAENDLREIAATLAPIENQHDASWDRGAQEFVYGTMLAMLEDSVNPSLNMTREKFNFYNLAKICNFKDPDPDNPYKTLRQYYTGRDKLSKVLQLVSTAINNAPSTTKSYMGIVSNRMGMFNDSGMCFATSLNEMNFDTFADKPTALFIIIPDEKESRHGVATMMVSQLYKKLVEMASGYKGNKLPRTVYFLLDEFANLPKIEKIDTMITVARSRNIFFSLVVQSFSQLNSKYGDDVAAVLKGNCPIKIFVGTDDVKTCEEFSKLCGDVTLQTTSTSESKQKDDKGKENPNKTTSVSTTSRPLIYPDELTHISKKDGSGDMIVKILNEFPIRTKSAPYWDCPMMDHRELPSEYFPSRALNEAEVMYSIAERNSIILQPKKPALDDDEF